MDNYFQKYIKYKNKYNLLKGGGYSKRENFIILKYNSSNKTYGTFAIKKNDKGYEFNFSMLFKNTIDIIESRKKLVNYDDKEYILFCKNSDKNIDIEVKLNLEDKTFIITIKKPGTLINFILNGNFECEVDQLRNFKFTIENSNIITNSSKYPFIIHNNKQYTLKEIFNGNIVKTDDTKWKKLDELFDFDKFTIPNIFNDKSNKVNKEDLILNKIIITPDCKILVYDEDIKEYLYYDTLSLKTIDGKKIFFEKNKDYEISYLHDLDYTVYVDNNTKNITKIRHKNFEFNGSFSYTNGKFNIDKLDKLIINNNIEITLSNFKSCALTDFFKNKYDIDNIISSDHSKQSIIDYLNKDDPNFNDIRDVSFDKINTYDYEGEYDKFRDKYMNIICQGQTILFKSIYNSLFNLVYIENRDEINKIRNINILTTSYIKTKLLIKFNSIKCDLHKICNTSEDKDFLLQNITKKIITTNKDFEIFSNNTKDFIKFPNDLKLVFDTGNASGTIIGREIVERLGLEEKDIFITTGSGVGTGTSEFDGKYVTVKLKFKSDSAFNIKDKVYEFNAIVSSSSITDTLLLGQSSNGLKKFFEDNYCIVYDNSKTKYNKEYKENLININKAIKDAQKASTDTEIKNIIILVNEAQSFLSSTFLDDDRILILFNELKNIKFKNYIDRLLLSIKNNTSNFKKNIEFIIMNNYLIRSILNSSDWDEIVRELKGSISKLNDPADDNLIKDIKKLK
jgi:hypothetical protein